MEEDNPAEEFEPFEVPFQGPDIAPAVDLSPDALPGFSYSHIPPGSITGRARWPGTHDSQSYPATATAVPTLPDVWVHVQSSLSAADRHTLHQVAIAFSHGSICSPLWLTRPWQPHRRRRYGFGAVSSARSATTDCPTIFHVFHQTWPFLLPVERRRCQQSSSALLHYSFQRVHAAVTSIASLRAPRPSPSKPISIDRVRTRLFGSALLRFDFVHGDLVRWLSGEYTNRHRDWTETFRRLQSPPRLGHPRRLPPPDFPRAQRIATEGVPLTGSFVSHPPRAASSRSLR